MQLLTNDQQSIPDIVEICAQSLFRSPRAAIPNSRLISAACELIHRMSHPVQMDQRLQAKKLNELFGGGVNVDRHINYPSGPMGSLSFDPTGERVVAMWQSTNDKGWMDAPPLPTNVRVTEVHTEFAQAREQARASASSSIADMWGSVNVKGWTE